MVYHMHATNRILIYLIIVIIKLDLFVWTCTRLLKTTYIMYLNIPNHYYHHCRNEIVVFLTLCCKEAKHVFPLSLLSLTV